MEHEREIERKKNAAGDPGKKAHEWSSKRAALPRGLGFSLKLTAENRG